MFQTNTAREIFYIFSWLAGIILLYAFVFTFMLEPSNGNIANNTHQVVASHTTDAHQSMEKSSVTPVKTVVKQHLEKTVEIAKSITPVAVKKVPHKVEKLASKNTVAVDTTKTVKVEATKKTEEPVKKEVKKSVKTPVVKHIEKKTVITEKTIHKVTQSPIQVVSTPTVPTVISMPKSTVSIPSTPSVPSVPTIPNSKKVETVKVQKATVETKEQTLTQKKAQLTKELKKVLSSDEEMKLIETARKHVVEKAEAARQEAMKTIER